jgi:hypothetical protein
MIGVLFMKKVIATVLALGMTTLLFAACNKPSETTTDGTTAVTTTGDASVTTTAPAPVETTTTKPRIEFADEDMIDNVAYGYYCKILRDDKNEIIGMAVSGWKNDDAKAGIAFDSEYTFVDDLGVQSTLPIVQVGVGQGVVTFQSKLESVVIPAGVTKIANKAFPGCTKLTSVTLPEGLTSIGEMAFWNCTSLETVVIPSTVTEIGKYAFSDCVNLKSATLPASFESQKDLVANIFDGCPDVVITYAN